MNFEFATETRILFGPGCIAQAAPAAATMGKRAMVVTGGTPERTASCTTALSTAGMATVPFPVAAEPDVNLITRGVACSREKQCDVIIGIGGGSVIDAAKAIAAISVNSGDLIDHLEVVGKGIPLTHPSLPCIAVPTTAGTGAEVTRNAVISVPDHKVKVSLRSPFLLPRLAIIDPMLTLSLPPEATASTGLDALTQCIEGYVSCKANPLTDGCCREGITRATRSLRQCCTSGDDLTAREDMAAASLLSGMALANAGLGAVHGFAGPIGGMCGSAHGAVCALLLPQVMAMNVTVLRKTAPDAPALDRYSTIARLCTGDRRASAEDGVAWIRQLCAELPLPRADRLGLTPEQFPAVVAAAAKASSMKGNPVKLSNRELMTILAGTFGS